MIIVFMEMMIQKRIVALWILKVIVQYVQVDAAMYLILTIIIFEKQELLNKSKLIQV
jgi:hypothetical protein